MRTLLHLTLPMALATLPLLLPSSAAATLNSNLASITNGGGCSPTSFYGAITDQLTLINPEWAPVKNGQTVDSGPIIVHGEVEEMHGDHSGDFPSTHIRADVNHFLRLDPGEEGLLADGNVEEDGRLHTEWEAGVYPSWAWAGPGDRMIAMGRHIFDCGHPGAHDGFCSATTARNCNLDEDCRPPTCTACGATETCAGVQFEYSSELHPPYATAAIRRGRGGIVSTDAGAKPVLSTRADIYVSPDAGGAGDRCILSHLGNPLDQLTVQCWPADKPVATLNKADFHFLLPMPPRPSKGRASWKITPLAPPGGVAPKLRVKRRLHGTAPSLEIIVRLTRKVGGQLPTGLAATIDAGWRNDPTPVTHLRVTAQGLVIRNALQPAAPSVPRTCSTANTPCATTADCPATEQCQGLGGVKTWQGQMSVNGMFQEWSGLATVSSGDVVPQNLVWDLYLRADDQLTLYADARSQECIDKMYARSLAQGLADLGFSKGLACLATEARNPGELHATYAGPNFGAGGSGSMDYETVTTGGTGGHCSLSTGLLCTVSLDFPSGETCNQEGGSMAVRYQIERLPS